MAGRYRRRRGAARRRRLPRRWRPSGRARTGRSCWRWRGPRSGTPPTGRPSCNRRGRRPVSPAGGRGCSAGWPGGWGRWWCWGWCSGPRRPATTTPTPKATRPWPPTSGCTRWSWPSSPAPAGRASGWFRAAVFGANGSLVSSFSLVAGMAGQHLLEIILLAGLAGLLARALSMAAGEYVSVRSQRELLDATAHELDPATLATLRDHEAHELALVFQARGCPGGRAAGRALLGQPDDPPASPQLEAGEDVIGSAWAAAGSSFVAAGAVVPVLPLFVTSGRPAIVAAAVLVGLALFATGAYVRRAHRRTAGAPGTAPAGHRRGRRSRDLRPRPGVRRHPRLGHRVLANLSGAMASPQERSDLSAHRHRRGRPPCGSGTARPWELPWPSTRR